MKIYFSAIFMEIRSNCIEQSRAKCNRKFGSVEQLSIRSAFTFPWVIIASDGSCVAREEGERDSSVSPRSALLLFSLVPLHVDHLSSERWTNGPLSHKFLDRGPRAGNRPSKPHPYIVVYARCVSMISHKSDPITITGDFM